MLQTGEGVELSNKHPGTPYIGLASLPSSCARVAILSGTPAVGMLIEGVFLLSLIDRGPFCPSLQLIVVVLKLLYKGKRNT